MKTSKKQTSEPIAAQLTCFPVGSRDCVNLSHPQESEKERTTTATSGLKCLEQFGRFNRATLWARTFVDLLIGTGGWYSTKVSLTWKLKATKSHRFYFQLAPSTLPIGGTGFGLLPTVKTFDHGTQRKLDENGKNISHTTGRQYGVHLTNMAKAGLLPTPKSTEIEEDYEEWKQRMKDSGNPKNIGKTTANLGTMAKSGMLPTPAASNHKGGCTRTDEDRQNDTLAHAIHGLSNGEPGTTSQLNPRFVAEMMGFPPDYLELPFQSTEKNP